MDDDKYISIHCRKKRLIPDPGKYIKRIPIEPTIPGHPNCHYGDCLGECHVASCLIYLGYEEMPMLPKDYEPEYIEIEVDLPDDESNDK